jgi:transposase, IS5 family
MKPRRGEEMAKIRCKETAADSFFGNFLYDQKVSRTHFLRKLNEVIEWEGFTKKLLIYYQGKGQVGQAPYNPTLILKMLLLSYLWNISERQVEVLANDSLSVGLFLGIGANERVPDHSTLTLFKNRLIQSAGMKAYETIFNEIIQVAQDKGVKFGQLQIVDSVHLIADVNITKDRQRQKGGKPPRDKDANWGAKGDKVVETVHSAERKTAYFYGYKDQVSLNAESGLVTSVVPGHADDYDGHKFQKLVEKDLEKGLAVDTIAADKGYDDGENHYYLEKKGINSAIRLKRSRIQKKDTHKEGWLKLTESRAYQEGLKQRYQIERKFGEARKWHGFMRCRYLGYTKHGIQSYLTFMALNLKRLVKLLTGVSFKGESWGWVGASMPIR